MRLLAEIKSLAICWEAKTSLSAGAYSLKQGLMWQNLSEPLTLWGEAGPALGLLRDFGGFAEGRVQQLPTHSATAPEQHPGPEGSWDME